MNPPGSLTARLRGHLPDPLDPSSLAWWVPSAAGHPLAADGRVARLRWRLTRRRRAAELAQIVAHLTVLVGVGHTLPEALAWLAAHSRGAVGEDLRVVGRWISEGVSPAVALRRWAASAASHDLRQLAAVVAGPAHEVTDGLDDLTRALEQRVHDDRSGILLLAVHGVWALAVVALVAVIPA